MMQWSDQILDEFLAPGISKFVSANIADLRENHPEADHWISNHLLNSVFRGRWPRDTKASVLNLLFRARTAFSAYHRARDFTLDFLGRGEPSNPASRLYFDAVASWETTLLNVQHAQEVMRRFADADGFAPGDGSDDERLWLLVNRIKHCGDDIAKGIHTSDHTIPMWMTNEGLASNDPKLKLTWEEVSTHVDALAKVADDLKDPLALVEKHKGRTDR